MIFTPFRQFYEDALGVRYFPDSQNTFGTHIFNFINGVKLELLLKIWSKKCQKTGFLDFEPLKNFLGGKNFTSFFSSLEVL